MAAALCSFIILLAVIQTLITSHWYTHGVLQHRPKKPLKFVDFEEGITD